MLQLLTLVALACALTQPVVTASPADAPATSRSTRVRSSDARTAALLVQGLQRSATIRRLVEQLEHADVIVYLEMKPALQRRLAGTLTWMTKTKDHRYVRISLNPDMTTDALIATLGHELQHALEVARAPQIVNDDTLARFYELHVDSIRTKATGWDTEAARQAGELVRRELAFAARTASPTRVADSIQDLDPDQWLNVYRRARGMLPP